MGIELVYNHPTNGLSIDFDSIGGCDNIVLPADDIFDFLDEPEAYVAQRLGFTVPQYRKWVLTDGTVICELCGAYVSNHCELSPERYRAALADPRCGKCGGSVLCNRPHCYKHRRAS